MYVTHEHVLLNVNKLTYIRRKDNQVNNPSFMCPTLRWSVSVMVGGCVFYYEIEILRHVHGKRNAQKYN